MRQVIESAAMPATASQSLAPNPMPKRQASAPTSRFEVIKPPHPLLKKVTYREAGPGTVDPIRNAEQQLDFLVDQYEDWLAEDRTLILETWNELSAKPNDCVAFRAFHHALHQIRGNASMLDCPAASEIATPMARLLERSPPIEKHRALIQNAVYAISLALSGELDENDPQLDEIKANLSLIVSKWISGKR